VIGQVSRLLIRFPVSLQLVVVRLAIRIWKPVGSVTCVQVYCFTVLPFYRFTVLRLPASIIPPHAPIRGLFSCTVAHGTIETAPTAK